MKDWKTLIDSMLGVAKSVAPLVPGAPQAIEAATKVVEMIDHAREIFEADAAADTGADAEDAMEALVAKRDEIERSVNAHVDRTVADLRGRS